MRDTPERTEALGPYEAREEFADMCEYDYDCAGCGHPMHDSECAVCGHI